MGSLAGDLLPLVSCSVHCSCGFEAANKPIARSEFETRLFSLTCLSNRQTGFRCVALGQKPKGKMDV